MNEPPVLEGRWELRDVLRRTPHTLTRRALDRERSGRACAVKTLVPDAPPAAAALLRREAELLGAIGHPQVPPRLALVDDGTTLHLVREWVEGWDIASALAAGERFPEGEIARIGASLSGILADLHDRPVPVWHRDLRPASVVIDGSGVPFLVDFAGARTAGDAAGGDVDPAGPTWAAWDVKRLGLVLLSMAAGRDLSAIDAAEARRELGRVPLGEPLRRLVGAALAGEIDAGQLRDRLSAVAREAQPKLPATGTKVAAMLLVAALLVVGAAILVVVISRHASESDRVSSREPARRERAPRTPDRPTPRPVAAEPSDERAPAGKRPPAQPAEADVVLRARVFHDGRPVNEVTRARPSFWFRDESIGKEAKPKAFWSGHEVRLTGLRPGRYGMNVRFDANPGNPFLYPGDFDSWTVFEVPQSGAAQKTIDVVEILHLTSPQDNGAGMEGWDEACEGKTTFAPAMLFAWKPLAQGTVYEWSIERIGCPYDDRGTVARGETSTPSFELRLAPNNPGEFYLLRLSATREGRRIGILETHGPRGGLGWDYRFRVE